MNTVNIFLQYISLTFSFFEEPIFTFFIVIRLILSFIFFYGLVSFSRKFCLLQGCKHFPLCSRKYLDLTSCTSIIGQGDFSLPAQLSWYLYQKSTSHVYVSQFLGSLFLCIHLYIYLYAEKQSIDYCCFRINFEIK